MSNSVRPRRRQPTRLRRPCDSPGKNTGVGCHFLLQCVKVKSEREVAQSCRLLATPWTAAFQAPLSMGFSRQEDWSGVPLPSPQDGDSRTLSQIWSPLECVALGGCMYVELTLLNTTFKTSVTTALTNSAASASNLFPHTPAINTCSS